jgi:hypothetical protein
VRSDEKLQEIITSALQMPKLFVKPQRKLTN